MIKITEQSRNAFYNKECLNSLDGVNIVQRNFVWFINGVEWDGELININL